MRASCSEALQRYKELMERARAAESAVLRAARGTLEANGWAAAFTEGTGEAEGAAAEGPGGAEGENGEDGKDEDPEADPGDPIPQHGPIREFRLRGRAFMVTWNSLAFGTRSEEWAATWDDFKAFIEGPLKKAWKFREWSGKLERSLDSPEEGRVHLHAYLADPGPEEWDTTALDTLKFQGVKPRIDTNKEKRGPYHWGQAKWHGHYYVFCPEKVGSLFWATSVQPWAAYLPEAWWIVRLWKAHKIDHNPYLKLSARLRDGHARRKADVEAVRLTESADRHAKEKAEAEELLARRWCNFKEPAPEMRHWQSQYLTPDKRYKLLVLHGPSGTGKTELAKSLYGEAHTCVVGVENATVPGLRGFDRQIHKCIVFDEMGPGGRLILDNKKLMQAHKDGATLGKSPTGGWEYEVWLWRVPLICTTNHWPPEKLCAADADWLAKNVIDVRIAEPVWEAGVKRGREDAAVDVA